MTRRWLISVYAKLCRHVAADVRASLLVSSSTTSTWKSPWKVGGNDKSPRHLRSQFIRGFDKQEFDKRAATRIAFSIRDYVQMEIYRDCNFTNVLNSKYINDRYNFVHVQILWQGRQKSVLRSFYKLRDVILGMRRWKIVKKISQKFISIFFQDKYCVFGSMSVIQLNYDVEKKKIEGYSQIRLIHSSLFNFPPNYGFFFPNI